MKKLLSIILVLTLCLSLMCLPALAEEATDPVDPAPDTLETQIETLDTDTPDAVPEPESEPEPVLTKLVVGNDIVVDLVDEKPVVLMEADANGTWSYDSDTNTLTLKGADIAVSDRNYGIEARGDLNLVLEGKNTVHCDSYYGIYTSGTLTITGSGSLTADGSDFGIATGNALNIGDCVTISAASGAVTAGNSYGIQVGSNATLSGRAKVTANGGTAPDKSYGIYSGATVTVCDNAQLSTTASEGLNSYGIYAYSAVVIDNCAKVTTTGGPNAGGYGGSYGIRTTRMLINNGSLTAVAAPSLVSSVGIYCSRFESNGGCVTARGDASETDGSWGIAAHNNVDINGGYITAIAGDAASSSCGFQMSDNSGSTCLMTVSGGSLTAKSGSADQTFGLDASELLINDGFLTVTAGKANGFSWGIRVANNLTVNGGTIIATGNSAETFSYGVLAFSAAIENASLTATAGSAGSSYGIRTFDALSIAKSIVTATGGKAETASYGIEAAFGSLTITDSIVTATGGEAETSDGIACPEGEYVTNGGKIIELNVPQIVEQSKQALELWKDKFAPKYNKFPTKFPNLWKDFFRK